MLEFLLLTLFAIVTCASVLSLVDSAMGAGHAFVSLQRERALLRQGFVPMPEHAPARLRRALGKAGPHGAPRRLRVRASFANLPPAQRVRGAA